MNTNEDKIEKVLWSIALPGFGQILNKQLTKGVFFILLEYVSNVMANLNETIISSFQGNIDLAIKQTNYQWLMFYPCIYMFAIYDAYKNAEGKTVMYAYLPFVGSAMLGTIGVVYSPVFKFAGILLGPIWLPIICFIVGAFLGLVIRMLLYKSQ